MTELLVNPTPIAPASAHQWTGEPYEAIANNDRRRAPRAVIQHEDRLLNDSRRRTLVGTTQDLVRNYTLASWMIRRHLDYVTHFQFHSRSGNDELDKQVESKVATWSRKEHCDIRGMFNLSKIVRTAEARSVIDGDIALLKLVSLHLQAIEGDRIRNARLASVDYATDLAAGEDWYNGVQVDPAGRPLNYAIHKRIRGGQGLELERIEPAENVLLHAKIERFDQVRGISPLVSAITDLVDIKEHKTLALLKNKVAQLFALVLKRDDQDSVGTTEETDDGTFEVDFGKGPIQLDLNRDDEAEFLSTDTKSADFREFHTLILQLALKSLDIPYSFYDEAHTNFFGSRGSWLLYDRSCISKRAEVADLLNGITTWLLRSWILSGEIALPAGQVLDPSLWEWVPVGMPWWDQSKEIRGDKEACGAGFDNPYRICKERGRGDFEDNARQLVKAMKFFEELTEQELGRALQLDFSVTPILEVKPDGEVS